MPTTIETYTVPSIYSGLSYYAVKADHIGVPVISFLTDRDYDYAHFSFSGSTTITITVCEPIDTYAISPLAFDIQGTVEGNKLTFDIQDSRYLIVKINNLKELVVIADPLEVSAPPVSGDGIFHVVANYSADFTGETMATSAIQEAINDASSAGGGVVYVPEGVFLIGNLILKSHVTLYLQGGAVLRATDHKEDYTVDFHKDSLDLDGTWFIQTEPNSTNITISGRGTIDGNGSWLRANQSFVSNLIVPMLTTNFTIDGIIGRDAGLWALIPTRSNHVKITNYKGFQSLVDYEDDAIDIVESQHVLVTHTIAISEDDPFSTKTWNEATDIAQNWPGSPQVLEHVTFDDVIAWTCCAAFKVGMGVEQAQRNVIFKNSYVYQASRALAIHHRFGKASAENITFENIDIEQVIHERNGPFWLHLEIEESGRGIGPVTQVLLKNIKVRDQGRLPSILRGTDPFLIERVAFEQIYMMESTKPAASLEEMNIRVKQLYVVDDIR
ncbi:glycoside hydrolase family 28 protein [Paenibacillus sp. LjRoot56]|uniref:glycoside hydrolase family 28 protein n=1 Tax=Paenibacillus sp. LjRoot56 TaxID=3342333 RepID=UPI003ECF5A63